MRPGLHGFLWGAALAGAGMLALPELLEADFRGPRRDGRIAEIVILHAAQQDFLGAGIELAGDTVYGTHISTNAFGMYLERKESNLYLPRSFSIRAQNIERAMIAHEPLCPIVVLATPDEIRISPCLRRVAAK
jgi:hypothetical protein